jgi:hypothetical protein
MAAEGYDVGRAIMENARPRRLAHLSRGGTALCAKCRGMNVQNLSAPQGYAHYSNPREMVESARTCPLCERFILRPLGVTCGLQHQAATGALSCKLVGPTGFKRLEMSTEGWVAQTVPRTTGKLLDVPLFVDAGELWLLSQPAKFRAITVYRRPSSGIRCSYKAAGDWNEFCIVNGDCQAVAEDVPERARLRTLA